mmetsp:Transcript_16332/g.51904  ORF Transcript_16332/g.51904 Transcript_16332/m.51904 type:complete len:200 (+) Transcript_16332:217-816(+)
MRDVLIHRVQKVHLVSAILFSTQLPTWVSAAAEVVEVLQLRSMCCRETTERWVADHTPSGVQHIGATRNDRDGSIDLADHEAESLRLCKLSGLLILRILALILLQHVGRIAFESPRLRFGHLFLRTGQGGALLQLEVGQRGIVELLGGDAAVAVWEQRVADEVGAVGADDLAPEEHAVEPLLEGACSHRNFQPRALLHV